MNPLLCLSVLALLATPAIAQETAVTLHISFDAAASTALQEAGEMVIVSTNFYGDPAPGNVLPLNRSVNPSWQCHLSAQWSTILVFIDV